MSVNGINNNIGINPNYMTGKKRVLGNNFNNQIEDDIKNSRRDTIMEIQQEVSLNNLKDKVGKVYECLIENITEDGEYYIARSYMDVPSEDGVIYVKYNPEYMVNEFVDVKIIDSDEYDLFGEFVE